MELQRSSVRSDRRRLRVVYSIGARFAGGGIGDTAHHAAAALDRHGVLVRVLCGSCHPASTLPATRVRELGPISRLLRRLAVSDPTGVTETLHDLVYDAWARRRLEPCDVFHGWNGHCLGSLREAARRGAITVVERASTHPRHRARVLREEHERRGRSDRVSRARLKRAVTELDEADHVLVPSDAVRQSFRAEGAGDSKLIQLPFGVDIERFRPGPARDSGCFRALFVGRIGLAKGVPDLLEAWRRLGWADAELWLLGRLSPEVARLLESEAPGGVRHLDHRDDPAPVYAESDVLVFPTLDEGSALVTYEAMACGLPVITTPAAGSLVRDGIDGFLVPIRDPEALCRRLEALRADPERRSRMGRSARRRVEGYTWRRYGDQLVQELHGAVDSARRRGDETGSGHADR